MNTGEMEEKARKYLGIYIEKYNRKDADLLKSVESLQAKDCFSFFQTEGMGLAYFKEFKDELKVLASLYIKSNNIEDTQEENEKIAETTSKSAIIKDTRVAFEGAKNFEFIDKIKNSPCENDEVGKFLKSYAENYNGKPEDFKKSIENLKIIDWHNYFQKEGMSFSGFNKFKADVLKVIPEVTISSTPSFTPSFNDKEVEKFVLNYKRSLKSEITKSFAETISYLDESYFKKFFEEENIDLSAYQDFRQKAIKLASTLSKKVNQNIFDKYMAKIQYICKVQKNINKCRIILTNLTAEDIKEENLEASNILSHQEVEQILKNIRRNGTITIINSILDSNDELKKYVVNLYSKFQSATTDEEFITLLKNYNVFVVSEVINKLDDTNKNLLINILNAQISRLCNKKGFKVDNNTIFLKDNPNAYQSAKTIHLPKYELQEEIETPKASIVIKTPDEDENLFINLSPEQPKHVKASFKDEILGIFTDVKRDLGNWLKRKTNKITNKTTKIVKTNGKISPLKVTLCGLAGVTIMGGASYFLTSGKKITDLVPNIFAKNSKKESTTDENLNSAIYNEFSSEIGKDLDKYVNKIQEDAAKKRLYDDIVQNVLENSNADTVEKYQSEDNTNTSNMIKDIAKTKKNKEVKAKNIKYLDNTDGSIKSLNNQPYLLEKSSEYGKYTFYELNDEGGYAITNKNEEIVAVISDNHFYKTENLPLTDLKELLENHQFMCEYQDIYTRNEFYSNTVFVLNGAITNDHRITDEIDINSALVLDTTKMNGEYYSIDDDNYAIYVPSCTYLFKNGYTVYKDIKDFRNKIIVNRDNYFKYFNEDHNMDSKIIDGSNCLKTLGAFLDEKGIKSEDYYFDDDLEQLAYDINSKSLSK